jgi:hypothetical protein
VPAGNQIGDVSEVHDSKVFTGFWDGNTGIGVENFYKISQMNVESPTFFRSIASKKAMEGSN